MLVLITVIAYGIHLAEISYFAPKVAEANMSALWDTTAKKMHSMGYNPDFNPRAAAITGAEGEVEPLYANWDGRRGAPGAGSVTHVFTQTQGQIDLTCQNQQLINMDQPRIRPYPNGNGGISCSAAGKVRSNQFPKTFMESTGGFFRQPNYPPGLTDITLCGIGRAQGGNCSGFYSILLDDWGLAGADESGDCLLTSCTNVKYKELIHRAYDDSGAGGAAGKAFAMAITGVGPGGYESEYRFSFNSAPDPGMPGGDMDPANWTTNVVNANHNSNHQARPENDKFLGVSRGQLPY